MLLPVSARCVCVVHSVNETSSFHVTDLGCAPQSCSGTRQETRGGVVPWIALSRDCWSLCGLSEDLEDRIKKTLPHVFEVLAFKPAVYCSLLIFKKSS